jgi:hypothetical protein
MKDSSLVDAADGHLSFSDGPTGYYGHDSKQIGKQSTGGRLSVDSYGQEQEASQSWSDQDDSIDGGMDDEDQVHRSRETWPNGHVSFSQDSSSQLDRPGFSHVEEGRHSRGHQTQSSAGRQKPMVSIASRASTGTGT